MNIYTFDLPDTTDYIAVKAVPNYEDYFNKEIFPKLIRMGFRLDTNYNEEDVYYKDDFLGRARYNFEDLVNESHVFTCIIGFYRHNSKNDCKYIKFIFNKDGDAIEILPVENQ